MHYMYVMIVVQRVQNKHTMMVVLLWYMYLYTVRLNLEVIINLVISKINIVTILLEQLMISKYSFVICCP